MLPLTCTYYGGDPHPIQGRRMMSIIIYFKKYIYIYFLICVNHKTFKTKVENSKELTKRKKKILQN